MTDPPIGSEGVARLHEEAGNQLMAAVHRLTGDQAVSVLAGLAGWDPRLLTELLTDVGVTVEREAAK